MRLGRAVILSIAALLGMLAVAAAAGLRVNLSPSLPKGLWLTTPISGPIRKGDVVQFCPPGAKAACSPMFLKPIIATAGDLVVAGAAGVTVNGRLIAHSVRAADAAPSGINYGAYRLAEGELWVLSTHHPRSFDSRYFGAVKRSAVRATARPLLVWK